MDIKKLHFLLQKTYPTISFIRKKVGPEKRDAIFCLFANQQYPYRFMLDTRFVGKHLIYLKFFFGKIEDFNNALFLVNELNAHTIVLFRSILEFNDGEYYFILDYWNEVDSELDALASIKGALNFLITNEDTKLYLSPLYKLTKFKIPGLPISVMS